MIPDTLGFASKETEVKVKSLSRVRLFVTPWIVAYQAPPSVGFSRQEYWRCWRKSTGGNGGHFLLQGIFPTQGSNPGLPHCRQTLYPLSHQESPRRLRPRLIRRLAPTWLGQVHSVFTSPRAELSPSRPSTASVVGPSCALVHSRPTLGVGTLL